MRALWDTSHLAHPGLRVVTLSQSFVIPILSRDLQRNKTKSTNNINQQKSKNIMEKTIYTAPATEVLEIATEGVLCASLGTGNGSATNEKWAYDNDLWS